MLNVYCFPQMSSLKKQVGDAHQALEASRAGEIPSVILTDGSRKSAAELMVMVPSFDWTNFFGGLDRVNAQGNVGASSPTPPTKPPRVSRAQQEQYNDTADDDGIHDVPSDMPLPSGWSLENHNGKPLYGECARACACPHVITPPPLSPLA